MLQMCASRSSFIFRNHVSSWLAADLLHQLHSDKHGADTLYNSIFQGPSAKAAAAGVAANAPTAGRQNGAGIASAAGRRGHASSVAAGATAAAGVNLTGTGRSFGGSSAVPPRAGAAAPAAAAASGGGRVVGENMKVRAQHRHLLPLLLKMIGER